MAVSSGRLRKLHPSDLSV